MNNPASEPGTVSVSRELLVKMWDHYSFMYPGDEVTIELKGLLAQPAEQQHGLPRSVKRYERDAITGHCDVEIPLPEHMILHHDHGPNLAEALARLAYRVAKFHKLQAPSLVALAQAPQQRTEEQERAEFEKAYCEYFNALPNVTRPYTVEQMKASRDGDNYGHGSLGKNLRWEGFKMRAALGTGAVKLPERMPEPSALTTIDDDREAGVWNSCLDEVARLNALPAGSVD